MQVRDELRVLVEAETARAIENFKKLSDGIDDSEKKSQSLGEALDSLSKKSLIISGVFTGAGVAAVKFAGENQKLQLSLKNMLGSAEEAGSVFEEWRQLGNSPGLSVNEVVSLGRAMVNMGHDTQYATSTMQMLGNVAAGTGVSFGEISGSFERARAMGNLTTRDLVRLQQQGIPIVKQLAKELSTTEENVRRLAAEGKISFSEMERAFKSMTSPGGQFAGMMDELSGTVLEKFSTAASDAKQALASFGEILLPMATELLNSASHVLRGITDMDDSAKRFILTIGGLVAAAGPATKAIGGISKVIKVLAGAGPALAVGGGIIAGFAMSMKVFSDTGAKLEQAARDYDASTKKIIKSNQELISSASFTEVSNQVRGLTWDMYNAARETGNFAAATEAAVRLLALNQRLVYVMNQADQAAAGTVSRAQALIDILEMPVDPNLVITSWIDEALNGYTTEIRKIEDAFELLYSSGYSDLQRLLEFGYPGWAEAVASQSSEAMLRVLKNIDGRSPEAKAEIERIQKEISELGSGATIRPFETSVVLDIADARKSWQEWFGEITKVDPSLFGSSGARAAELYIGEFERTLTAQSTIAQALGEQLDVSRVLRSRQADVQNALVELFSIDPNQINESFTLVDNSIKRLVEEYQKLGEEAKKLEDSFTISNTLESLSREVQNLGKDQYDLALATLEAAGALEEEMEQARELVETLRAARDATGELQEAAISFHDFFAKKITDGLMNVFPELEKQAAEAIGNISAQLAAISFDSALTGLNTLGEAFAKGGKAADGLRQAMADMAQQILNQLPSMFLQAGLQLIAQGQWPLGLGFVAAAGSSAIIGGYVKGTIDRETNATKNAHGNAFDSNGIIPFAHGGSFTNQIVSRPTCFRFGGKFGVMGEAGPESIMPLRRMNNGDLGVAASGAGGAQVTVNIINNSGAAVRKEEHTNGEGNRQIDVIIGQAVNSHISSGKADRAMARYGVRPSGV